MTVSGLTDLHIQQPLDYPTLDVAMWTGPRHCRRDIRKRMSLRVC